MLFDKQDMKLNVNMNGDEYVRYLNSQKVDPKKINGYVIIFGAISIGAVMMFVLALIFMMVNMNDRYELLDEYINNQTTKESCSIKGMEPVSSMVVGRQDSYFCIDNESQIHEYAGDS